MVKHKYSVMKIFGYAGMVLALCSACTKRTEVAVPGPEKAVIRASTAELAPDETRTSFDGVEPATAGKARYGIQGDTIAAGRLLIKKKGTHAGNTRTSFSDDAVLVWRTGDAFGLFSDSNDANTRYELDPATAGSTDGRFTGDRIEGTEFYAYYPYGAASLSGSTLTLTLPDVQQGTAGNFSPEQNPMVAKGDSESLYFRSLCGVIKLQVTGTHTLTKVVFAGNDGEIAAGEATVRMDYTDAPALAMAEGGSRTLTLDLGAGLALTDTPQTLYLVVPPRTYAKGFTVTLTDSNGRSAVRSTDRSVTVTRSVIKPMTAFEAEFLILWSDTEGLLTNVTTQPAAGAIDLSGELANSYVIPGAGNYKIPTQLIDGTKVSDTEYIGFTVTGNEGNAVVVVEDADGKILWSWHIWCVNDLDVSGIPIGSYTYLDRNLGATATGPDAGEAAYGCFYQWGRKDPFPRKGLQNLQTLDQVVLPLGKIYVALSTATIAQAAAYPGVFFYTPDTDDWNTEHAENLWQPSPKTIFDPCPAGYEVPEIGQLRNLFAQPVTAGTAGCTIGGSWFPTTGYCEAVIPVVQAIGSLGYGWSDNAFTSGSSKLYYLAQTFITAPTWASVSADGIGYSRGYGLSVRCVRIQ